jgi:hypothetical protein
VTLVAPAAVYLLCLLTSSLCAALMLRAYVRGRARLLLWTAISFIFLALNNLFLVADMVVFPSVDLWLLRPLAALAAIAVLLYGFVWEAER